MEIIKEFVSTPICQYTRIGEDACFRIIGYDAFEHFGFTREEAEFMTSHGNWVCIKGNNGTCYSFDGVPQGKNDFEFVFNTALDVLGVVTCSKSIDQNDKNRYCELMCKLIRGNRQMVKARYPHWIGIGLLNERQILNRLCDEIRSAYKKAMHA